ncbi:hypothetical protein DXA54_05005, partial [Bacteroides sp. OF03-11BH]|uniref:hypothetical protein n=1 Tax=Bacteroides sp. OF03-11BH TaxID=2292957 RepID=UPI000EE137CD
IHNRRSTTKFDEEPKIGINSLGITFSGYNLLTFTPMKYVDPESVTSNAGKYPLVKLYNFGLNLNF